MALTKEQLKEAIEMLIYHCRWLMLYCYTPDEEMEDIKQLGITKYRLSELLKELEEENE